MVGYMRPHFSPHIAVFIALILVFMSYSLLFSDNTVAGAGLVSDGGILETTWGVWQPVHEYRSETDTTYIIYNGGANFYPYMVSYNHSTDTWSSSYLIDSENTDEAHSGASMCIDADGYIHAFYAAHNSILYHSVSTNPYNITSWDNGVANLTESCTYCNPLLLDDGDIGVAIRIYESGFYNQHFIRYGIANDTWYGDVGLFNPGTGKACYCLGGFAYDTWGGIHITVSLDDTYPSGSHGDCYYMYSDDNGQSWYNAGGTDITGLLPLNYSQANTYCIVESFNNYPGNAAHPTPRVSSHCGVPVIIYGKLINGLADYQYTFARWDGDSWEISAVTNFTKIGENGEHRFHMSTEPLYVDTDTYDLFLTAPVSGHFEVQQWRTTNNGATWAKIADITSGTTYNQTFMSRTSTGVSSFVFATTTSDVYSDNDGYIRLYENMTSEPVCSTPGSYDPPNITSMGYSGCYNQSNQSVMVGSFYVNFSYNISYTPSFFWLNISHYPAFNSTVKNVNITSGWTDGYCNETISTGVAASTSKYYVHVRGFYD